LKLADVDRRRIQAALTVKGFDTQGTDGSFGPRTRLMIANWQRSRNEPPSGFLSATQAALLSSEGEAALSRLEEERRKAEEERRKADAERQKAKPAPPAAAPAPGAPPSSPIVTKVTVNITANSNTQCDRFVTYSLEAYPDKVRLRFSSGWQDFPVAANGAFGRAVSPRPTVNLDVRGNTRDRTLSVTNVGNLGCTWTGRY
jgi:peptidoglycan hydrolase-like protein with peptidoglycan-binding domain